jgi:hypothetical protein
MSGIGRLAAQVGEQKGTEKKAKQIEQAALRSASRLADRSDAGAIGSDRMRPRSAPAL